MDTLGWGYRLCDHVRRLRSAIDGGALVTTVKGDCDMKMDIHTHQLRNRLRTHAARASLLAVLLCAAALTQAQQRVRVKFDPPDGTRFVWTAKIDKTVQQGEMPPTPQRTEVMTELTIRKTPTGYAVYEKPIMPADLDVPTAAADLVAGLFSNMNVTFDLDAQGNLRAIQGLDEAFAAVEETMPEEVKQVLQALHVDAEWLRQRATVEWKIRPPFDVAALSGQTVVLRDKRDVPDATFVSALGAFFKATGHVTTSDLFACGTRQCIRMESVAETNDPAVGEPLAQQMREMIVGMMSAIVPKDTPVPEVPIFRIRDVHERVRLMRVFEPASALPHAYLEDHQLTLTLSVEERTGTSSMPMKVSLRHEHTYTYP